MLLLSLDHTPGWVGPVAGITSTSDVYVRSRTLIDAMSRRIAYLEKVAAPTTEHDDDTTTTSFGGAGRAQVRQQRALQRRKGAGGGGADWPELQTALLLRARRRRLSHCLLQRIQASYVTHDVAGRDLPLLPAYVLAAQSQPALPLTRAGSFTGMPAGAGDCCAPKLLHAASIAGLQPLALAEVWCGSAPGTATPAKQGRTVPPGGLDLSASRVHGELYGPCDKCCALLGTMLCGL
jgi:hypothetical protein